MNPVALTRNAKVAVVGGGVSGLTFAYFLNKFRPDVSITIFEKSTRTGGWINSQVITVGNEAILLEKGPRTLRGVSNGTLFIVDTLQQLGKLNQIEVLPKKSIANKKWLWSDSGLIPVPNPFTWSSLFKFLSFSNIVKPKLFSGFLKESFVKPNHNDESIENFFKRRFGNTILTDNVLSAILHGIYAGDVSKLSIKSILPKIKQLEQEHGSLTKALLRNMPIRKSPEKLAKSNALPPLYDKYNQISSTDLIQLSKKLKQYPMIKLQNGLQEFTNAITEYLSQQDKIKIIPLAVIDEIDIIKGTIKLNSQDPQKFDHIRSTINVNELAKLVTGSDSMNKIKAILNDLQYVNIFLVNIYSKNSNLIPFKKNGFGFLVPKFDKNHHNLDCLLGIIYDSDVEKQVKKFDDHDNEIEPNIPLQNDYNKITLMMGGWYYNNETPSESFQIKCIKQVLKNYLQVDSNIKLIIRNEEKISEKRINDIGDDILVSFNYHKKCIPQYHVGYEQNKQELLTLLSDSKLSLGGMGFGKSIGVPDCVENAFEAASKLA